MIRRHGPSRTSPSNALRATPVELVAAPELALLALLDATLRIARDALLAAQPALVGDPPLWRVTPELIAARRLLRDATRLERAVADYRHFVLQTLHDEPHDDSLPF